MATRSSLPSMREYLLKMTDDGQWRLWLADSYMPDRSTVGGFHWIHQQLRSAILSPGSAIAPRKEFATLYTHLTAVRWEDVASAGELFTAERHSFLTEYGIESRDAVFQSSTTRVFGNTIHGDVMVYNDRGVAGFVSHEDGAASVVGSIAVMLNTVFAALVANRDPSIDIAN